MKSSCHELPLVDVAEDFHHSKTLLLPGPCKAGTYKAGRYIRFQSIPQVEPNPHHAEIARPQDQSQSGNVLLYVSWLLEMSYLWDYCRNLVWDARYSNCEVIPLNWAQNKLDYSRIQPDCEPLNSEVQSTHSSGSTCTRSQGEMTVRSWWASMFFCW